jgi:hypothetical protein
MNYSEQIQEALKKLEETYKKVGIPVEKADNNTSQKGDTHAK